MQAVVKTPHIEINIKGNISKQLITLLKKEYGKKLRFTGQEDNELMNVFETDWYKKVKSETSPGDRKHLAGCLAIFPVSIFPIWRGGSGLSA
jgi:hypothetical protein